jgi:hypothetical protein
MFDVEMVARRPVRVFALRLKTITGQEFIIEPMEGGAGLVIKADGVFAQGGKAGELLVMTVENCERTLKENG